MLLCAVYVGAKPGHSQNTKHGDTRTATAVTVTVTVTV
jgi:hypothetical protein